jgi:hypothetical protein
METTVMTTEVYTHERPMAIPPRDPREQAVIDRFVHVGPPETDDSVAEARHHQRVERCEAIAEPNDEDFAREARMVIVILCEQFTAERVHRWVRNQALIQDGVNYCDRGRR